MFTEIEHTLNDEVAILTYHWYKDRAEVEDVMAKIVTPNEEVRDFLEPLADYALMPAIEDTFALDSKRHAWLATTNLSFEDYSRNRLRVNKIFTVLGALRRLSEIAQEQMPDLALDLRVLSYNLEAAFLDEERSKMSVEFADDVAEFSLDTLKLFVPQSE